jgi:hypothetical protein
VAGQFASAIGSLTCRRCSPGYWSGQASDTCDVAAEGYFLEPDTTTSSKNALKEANAASEDAKKVASAAAEEEAGSLRRRRRQLTASTINNTTNTNDDLFLKLLVSNVSSPCVEHASCLGGLVGPIPDKGYWVDRSSYAFAAAVYRCPRNTCRGGGDVNESCFQVQAYGDNGYNGYSSSSSGGGEDDELAASVSCNNNNNGGGGSGAGGDGGSSGGGGGGETGLTCTEGALGPLCGSCGSSYIYRGELKQCQPCSEASGATVC